MSKGKLNAYSCPFGHLTVTVDRDEGVTPFMIRCRQGECHSPAYSNFYRVPGLEERAKPTHEWYKPGPEEYADLDEGMQEHVNQGGLLLREIQFNGLLMA